MVKLAELFLASRGAPIPWAGEEVQMMYEMPEVSAGAAIGVEFIHANSERPQALRMKCRGGTLRVLGQSLDDIVLWADKSPTIVEAVAEPKDKRKPLSIRIWNAWKDDAGVMHAWVGNSGLIVKGESGTQVVLRCSDGFDEPNFKDLVARVAVTPTT